MRSSLDTRCIHGDDGNRIDETFRPLSYPIFQSAAFSHVKVGHNSSGFDYSSETYPTRAHLEQVMASLEYARHAIAFNSGMAAVSTCLELFSPGDEILCSHDLYGGVFRLHKLVSRKNGLDVRYVDTGAIASVEAAITPRTRALYIETPTNPTMRITDIAACADLAHSHDALLIVDNTFLTPIFQNPLRLGADIVIHSASKYLGGHNDVIGGFICADDTAIDERLRLLSKTLGNALAPFDSWLILRGLKTLSLRMERQAGNAGEIAAWLERQPLVAQVLYPGLESFPQRELVNRQSSGAGAMISFYLNDAAAVEPLLKALKVITFAESLGGVESLITYPIIQTHADVPDDLKERLGINDRLVRLSVGAESAADLIADLDQAFGSVASTSDGAISPDDDREIRAIRDYGFDEVIDRRHSYSLKFDGAKAQGLPDGLLPLWVADMDFRCAPPILDALRRSVDFGIFGYSDVDDAYYDSVVSWFDRRFGWKPDPQWIVKTPGVVFALAQAVRAFTEPGDAILIQPPVYYPFFSIIRDNGRTLIENELVERDGRYEIDFDDFERKLKDESVKLFILCSPHNPVGRVWSREELHRIGELCARHHVRVVADEIHCDLTWPGHPHTMFADACSDLELDWISCTSPSKSFNLAGLQVSHIFIPDEAARKTFKATMLHSGYSQLNLLGLVAAKAAYDEGAPWLDACKAYMLDNLEFLRNYLAKKMPELVLVEPEGAYFAWIDCSALGLEGKALDDFIVSDAKLWLDGGRIFGAHSGQFQRIVLACPRETLAAALDRLKKAVDRLRASNIVDPAETNA